MSNLLSVSNRQTEPDPLNPRAHIGADQNLNVPEGFLAPTAAQQTGDAVETEDGDDDQQRLLRTELPQGEDGYYTDLDLEEQQNQWQQIHQQDLLGLQRKMKAEVVEKRRQHLWFQNELQKAQVGGGLLTIQSRLQPTAPPFIPQQLLNIAASFPQSLPTDQSRGMMAGQPVPTRVLQLMSASYSMPYFHSTPQPQARCNCTDGN